MEAFGEGFDVGFGEVALTVEEHRHRRFAADDFADLGLSQAVGGHDGEEGLLRG